MKAKDPSLTLLRDCTVEAAHAAGKVLVGHFGRKLRIREKQGQGLVTNADIESQEKVVKILKKGFKDFGYLGEEGDPVLSSSPGRWIIDPLDGTTNFIHGFPMFCVSIAAEWRGEVVVGVIYHPILKDTYIAIKGKGATLNGRKIRVSKTSKFQDALLTTGFAYDREESLRSEISSFQVISQAAQAVRRPGSAALDLAYTAQGVFDGFWERNLHAWDVAAGALLVTEAGGKVTDFKNQPFQVTHRTTLATNGLLHSKLAQTLSKT